LGGVLGALVTGTYLLPATGYQWTAAITVFMSLTIAILALICLGVRPFHVTPIAVAFLLLAWAFPNRPTELSRVSPFPGVWQSGELMFISPTSHSIDSKRPFSPAGPGLQ
jgi:hypothetical protein